MKALTTLLFFLGISTMAFSQTLTDEMVKDWERAKAYTLEYLEAMPADKYDLKPTPEMRSFAQQMLHINDANYGFVATATGASMPEGAGGSEKSEDQSKETVIKLVSDGYDFVIESIKKLPAGQFNEQIQLFGRFDMSRMKAIEKAFEHQTHHRGQTTVYLRLGGVTPPQEKLF